MFMAKSPSAAPASGARYLLSEWVGELVLQRFRLVTPAFGSGFRRFPGLVSRPEIGAARLGERLGLRPAPSFDLGVVARNQHLRDRLALEHRRTRVLRIFEQPVGKALLHGRGFLAHD